MPQVVAAIQHGDHDTFALVHATLHTALWRFAARYTGSRSLAEEIVQEAFWVLWQRRESLRAETNLMAYLYGVVRNQCRMTARHDRYADRITMAVEEHRLDPVAIGEAPLTPEALAEISEFNAGYWQALHALTTQERIALQLRFEEDRTYEEIGQFLGITKMGARKAVLRAVAIVQRILGGAPPAR